jgi:hypothetical protein
VATGSVLGAVAAASWRRLAIALFGLGFPSTVMAWPRHG